MIDPTPMGFIRNVNGVDQCSALLYRIWVRRQPDGPQDTFYVGQSTPGSERPFYRYDLNLRRMIAGKPPLNGKRYRKVIYDLRAAYQAGFQIGIELVCSIDTARMSIGKAERRLQELLGLVRKTRMLDDLAMPAGRRELAAPRRNHARAAEVPQHAA
jgi:hypothetical protein